MPALYTPPFTITPKVLDLVVQISEARGRLSVQTQATIQRSVQLTHLPRAMQAL